MRPVALGRRNAAPVGVPVHFVKDSRKCHREIIMEIIQKLA
jgi:hypothetical protein